MYWLLVAANLTSKTQHRCLTNLFALLSKFQSRVSERTMEVSIYASNTIECMCNVIQYLSHSSPKKIEKKTLKQQTQRFYLRMVFATAVGIYNLVVVLMHLLYCLPPYTNVKLFSPLTYSQDTLRLMLHHSRVNLITQNNVLLPIFVTISSAYTASVVPTKRGILLTPEKAQGDQINASV